MANLTSHKSFCSQIVVGASKTTSFSFFEIQTNKNNNQTTTPQKIQKIIVKTKKQTLEKVWKSIIPLRYPEKNRPLNSTQLLNP